MKLVFPDVLMMWVFPSLLAILPCTAQNGGTTVPDVIPVWPPPPTASPRQQQDIIDTDALSNYNPATVIPVSYGYFPEARPNHAACARGWLDLKLPQVHYKVTCHPQTSGNFAAARLDNLQLDIANLGSTPWAMAAARGIDIQVVYISHYMGDSQGLYVREANNNNNNTTSSVITTPFDLKGKSVGVPFGSTMHYQILFLIDLLDLTGQVDLINLPPSEIIKAWNDGIIDAAGCWGAARSHILDHGGRTLASAGLLADWGRPTFVVTAATRTFAQQHPEYITYVASILSRINDSFLDNLGQIDQQNIARWDARLPPGVSLVPSMVDALMLPSEQKWGPTATAIYRERQALDAFLQKHANEQLTCDYLGPGPRSCSYPSLQHVATRQTAEFLMQQKVLADLGPLETMGDLSSCTDATTFCGSDLYDGSFLANARNPCTDCLPVGPYAYAAPMQSSTQEGPDLLLATLEAYDQALMDRLPYAQSEAGRLGGNSKCQNLTILDADSGVFGDGANTEPGKTYSVNLNCRWIIQGLDCGDPSSQSCDDVVGVRFEAFRVWSGDYLRIFTDDKYDCSGDVTSMTLLGQFTGLYDKDNLPPPIAAKGCMTVVFNTDANQELTYGIDEGDGFEMTYLRDTFLCRADDDCNSGVCDNGVCNCNGQSWGSNCQDSRACFGTTFLQVPFGETSVLQSTEDAASALMISQDTEPGLSVPTLGYPNDLDCTFVIQGPSSATHMAVRIAFDLEPSRDFIYLQTSSGQEVLQYAVLTGPGGTLAEPATYYVPTEDGQISLRLVTDAHGRRAGFRAFIDAPEPSSGDIVCPSPGQSGYFCEFDHCIAKNNLQPTLSRDDNNPYVLGRIVSQVSGSVPAMPWSTEGGCEWPILPEGTPSNVDSIVALRFVFNTALDLEPQPNANVADKLVIRNQFIIDGQSENKVSEFYIEECENDEACSYPWQTGTCGPKGGCIVKQTIDVEYSVERQSQPQALLVTDRNDIEHTYSGLDLDVLLVKQCPGGSGEVHCEAAEGTCIHGGCFCGGAPCACTCEGANLTSISTGVKIGLVVGVIVPIFALLLLLFLWYRRRKIRKSRKQKHIIQEKEAELEAFRDSIVGMCTATKLYVPVLHAEVGLEEMPKPEKPCAPTIWCWMETSNFMDGHKPEDIVGDPADCWVKYNEDATMKLEAAYIEQGGAGEFSPMPGYLVNFNSMVQTKIATGFERDVRRIPGTPTGDGFETDTDLELSDIEFGGSVPEDLDDEPRMVLVEGDVIQISKQRPDGWAFGTKLQHADEGLSRQLVVVATSGNPEIDDSVILTDTGWFELDATRLPTTEDLALLHSRVGDTGELDPPDHWDPVADPTVAQQHPLPPGHSERIAVEQAFLSSLGTGAQIIRVERIQNLAMWQSYVVKRQTICYRETEQIDDEGDLVKREALKKQAVARFERCWLWHGTNTEVMTKILQQGFNRSFCGKNATVYGKGVYFARDSSYSASPTYAVKDSKGVQYVMACRVVVGEYCQGTYDALTPELRDAKKNILYDSTVGLLRGDTMNSPSIYVTYHDAQAYPEYLIAFKRN